MKWIIAGAILLAAFVLMGAKCVENTSLRRSELDGDWHLYGELHNETDTQGVQMAVLGTLLDANGNVMATSEAVICPIELSPKSLSTIDIDFNGTQNLPQPASYKVNVIRGKVLEQPLPEMPIDIQQVKASRSGGDVSVEVTIRLQQVFNADTIGCLAYYDSAGKVVEEITLTRKRALSYSNGATQTTTYTFEDITPAATKVRFWLIGPGSVPLESNYRAIASEIVPIN
jgi:hypothetical protein